MVSEKDRRSAMLKGLKNVPEIPEMEQVDALTDFACEFCGESFMLCSLDQVEVISGRSSKLGLGRLAFICPFCIAEMDIETLSLEFMQPSFVRMLYCEQETKRESVEEMIYTSIAMRALAAAKNEFAHDKG